MDDEKVFYIGLVNMYLKFENDKLKIVLMQSVVNVKKWEIELQILWESNVWLIIVLQELVVSVEQWKRQFFICCDENDWFCNKIDELEE